VFQGTFFIQEARIRAKLIHQTKKIRKEYVVGAGKHNV
jgi:hypothetical protein